MKREYKAGLVAAAVIGLAGAGMGVASASTPPAVAGQVVTAPAPAVPIAPVLAAGVLGAATYTFTDFGVAEDGRQAGVLLPAGGLTGRGVTATVLRMADRSSTRARLVPPGGPDGTNPLDLLLVTGATPTLSGFTLQGSPQGHLYNGLRLAGTHGARVTGVKVAAVPGDFLAGPGETFGISDRHGRGNTYTDIEVDGAGVGASGLGISDSDAVTVQRASLHDNPFSAGIAVWQTTGVTLTDVRTARNRTGMALERVGGTVLITRPTFLGNAEQDLYIGSDLGSARIIIADPVLAIGATLRVRMPYTEMGRPNRQLKSDLTVTRNGADVTARVVQWL